MSEGIDWEFRCRDCGTESEIADDETDFRPGNLALPKCPDCEGIMQHVGPILDECDKCNQPLLYHGNSGLGDDTLCENCYERLEAFA